jgi:hypothetical protein
MEKIQSVDKELGTDVLVEKRDLFKEICLKRFV